MDLRDAILASMLVNPSASASGRTFAALTTKRLVTALHRLGSNASREVSLKWLTRLARGLEDELLSLVSRHSVLWWLSIVRKIPLSRYLPPSPLPSTIAQIIWTFDRSLVRFGDSVPSDIYRLPDGTLAPDGSSADLDQVFMAFHLAESLYWVAACYRRVAKGASLQLKATDFECPASQAVNDLLRLFDERRNKYGDILDVFGTAERLRPSSQDETPFIRVSAFRIGDTVPVSITPVDYSLTSIRNAVEFWDKLDVEIRGHRPSELITLLSGLCWSRWAVGAPHFEQQVDVMNRDLGINGYSIVRKSALRSDLLIFIREIASQYPLTGIDALTAAVSDQLVDSFLREFSTRRSLDLHYGLGSPLLIEQEDRTVIDWLAVGHVIRDWVRHLVPSNRVKVGTFRGLAFQEELGRFLARELGTAFRRWPAPNTAAPPPAGLTPRDVDIGLIRENVLFLIEAKVKIGPATAPSEALASQARWEKDAWKDARDWLNKADRRAEALVAGHPTIDGHLLPKAVQFILPLVCTPFVTFTGSMDDRYLAISNVPRICTPLELLSVLRTPLDRLRLHSAVRVSGSWPGS